MSLASGRGTQAKLSTLIFHRVLPEADPLFPEEMHAARFRELCAWLRSWFRVLPLDEAALRLKNGTLPARACTITFDDGYADNHEVALPILREAGLPATFFVATGFLDGGRMWNDTVIEAIRRCALPVINLAGTPAASLGRLILDGAEGRRGAIDRAIKAIKYLDHAERLDWVAALAERSGAVLPDDLMMSSAQVRGLHAAGMQIGAHTVSHPILAGLPRAQARQEIGDSKAALEGLLGARVGLFAYPNGRPVEDYSAESTELVRELGFDAAVSTAWGAARHGGDLFQIPRFTPWDRQRLRFAVRLQRNLLAS
ncbi:polysaccharide deacetylase family protein [Roseateles sp. DAIF2]|uniref:polysaccharide deacetylase family protein n=1 Tax=Roseateles sp. DAIF2 TaxID=2714952 RepID=UPI00201D477C|nr:polysaccharide deacetylase family protein [Roseateles sp. DAIF2]